MVENPKEVQPYYDNVYDWVDSIDYSSWCCNPFMSPYGYSPYVVYTKLFDEPYYYDITPEELTMLRTTIQYKAVYLNSYFQKCLKFLQDSGFEVYRSSSHNNESYIGLYLRRGDISIYVSNQEVPQDYVPNTIELEICKYVTNKITGKKRRKSIETFAHIPMLDEFGEKTKQSFENYLAKIIK